MKRCESLDLPRPWGNQPTDPPDTPLAVHFEERFGPHFCWFARITGHKLNRVCLFGQRAECAWGVRDKLAFYCLWRYLELYPGSREIREVAVSLGMSRERVRWHYDIAIRKARESYKPFREGE